MANSTEDDSHRMSGIQYLFLVGSLGIIFAGLAIQFFIVAVNVNDWVKGRVIAGADKIITSIGISRIVFHNAALIFLFSSMLEIPQLVYLLVLLILQSSDFSNLWLSTLLSIFFYFKISTSHNIFVLWMKTIMSRRVDYLIVASVLVALGYSFLYFVLNFYRFESPTYGNMTDSEELRRKILSYIGLLWSTTPLAMFCTASFLLIALLGYHITKMNNGGHPTRSIDTYRRIMKFTFYSLMVLASNATFIFSEVYLGFSNLLCSAFAMNFFLVLQSTLLIYVAIKLRNEFFRVVCCGLFRKKVPGPYSRAGVSKT